MLPMDVQNGCVSPWSLAPNMPDRLRFIVANDILFFNKEQR